VSKWAIFCALCLIWGSSFILMKVGMFDNGAPVLSAWQVAGLRIFSASVVMLPFSLAAYKRIPAASRGFVILSGLLGSFLPAFLFCMAESKIESALAATLNSLTPIFAIIVAAVVYKKSIPGGQLLGVLIGFGGCLLLFVSKLSATPGHLPYAFMVILAALSYALNSNMVRQKLAGISSVDIAALAFAALFIPSGLILLYTGLFELPLTQSPYLQAVGASLVLGVLGTAFASIIFYMLVKKAGPVFASMVTYGIPFIAIGWGFYFGEDIGVGQLLALLVILAGVYIAGKDISKEGLQKMFSKS
jgi:drug/metabolite transporter (DMT)-like permease